ncbi:MAG: septum formation initiator family protein [Deltaproteobacteria bacterium]|nr:septum formation initiator family protein [Deltaproteobacteria bacterium]MBI3016760.1 septum formation initiator family protein [Deltaproteobacteria bacterium]
MITLFFTAFGEKGLIKIYKLNKQLRRIHAQKTFLEKNNQELTQDILKMKREKTFQEHSARETLGLAQDGEIIYEFSD